MQRWSLISITRRHALPSFLMLGFVAGYALVAVAGSYTARIVDIRDGDTVTVMIANERYLIRLAGIDAPEFGEPLWSASKDNLSRLALGKNVTIDCGDRDLDNRIVCKVLLADGEDVALEQIQAGMAVYYKPLRDLQAAADRASYAAAEDNARRAHLGIWAAAPAVPPKGLARKF